MVVNREPGGQISLRDWISHVVSPRRARTSRPHFSNYHLASPLLVGSSCFQSDVDFNGHWRGVLKFYRPAKNSSQARSIGPSPMAKDTNMGRARLKTRAAPERSRGRRQGGVPGQGKRDSLSGRRLPRDAITQVATLPLHMTCIVLNYAWHPFGGVKSTGESSGTRRRGSLATRGERESRSGLTHTPRSLRSVVGD